MMFCEQFCERCIHEKFIRTGDRNDLQCELLTLSLCLDTKDKDYPKEWIYDKHDNPTCTKFKRFDWKKDDDGNWIDPPKEDPVDPNQLIFPFVAEIPIETPK